MTEHLLLHSFPHMAVIVFLGARSKIGWWVNEEYEGTMEVWDILAEVVQFLWMVFFYASFRFPSYSRIMLLTFHKMICIIWSSRSLKKMDKFWLVWICPTISRTGLVTSKRKLKKILTSFDKHAPCLSKSMNPKGMESFVLVTSITACSLDKKKNLVSEVVWGIPGENVRRQ